MLQLRNIARLSIPFSRPRSYTSWVETSVGDWLSSRKRLSIIGWIVVLFILVGVSIVACALVVSSLARDINLEIIETIWMPLNN